MSRETRLMLASAFCSSLPIGLLLVFFPLYLHDLHMRSLLIGSIFTAAGLGSSLLLLVIGPLADRFGRRPFLLVGTTLPALGFVIFILSREPRWLVVASMLGGVGFSGGLGGGLVTATFNPILVGTVAPRLRTTVMSWSEAAWGISLACGALLAGLPAVLTRLYGLGMLEADRLLFAGCLVATLAATVLLLPVHERQASPAEILEPGGVEMSGAARDALPLLARLAVFFTLQGAGLGLVVQLLPLWFALRYHTTAATISPWFGAAQVAGLPLVFMVPALARRLGTARLIVLVAGSSTLLLAGVPLMPVAALAGTLFVMRSALVSMQWPAQLSFLMGAVHPRLRGTAASLALGCWSFANALLPILTGYLLDRGLLSWPLLLGVLCYGGAAAWFWLALRHTPLPEENAAKPAGLARGVAEAL